jgi:hypothetical protein
LVLLHNILAQQENDRFRRICGTKSHGTVDVLESVRVVVSDGTSWCVAESHKVSDIHSGKMTGHRSIPIWFPIYSHLLTKMRIPNGLLTHSNLWDCGNRFRYSRKGQIRSRLWYGFERPSTDNLISYSTSSRLWLFYSLFLLSRLQQPSS